MAEDLLLAAGLAHALDHRVVVQRVGQDQAVRDQLGERRDAGLVRDVARGEDQRRLLAVEVGELALEQTWAWLVPEMLRVPPAPVPSRSAASSMAPITGCWPMPR